MKYWSQMPWSSFSECWSLSQLFRSLTFIKKLFSSSSLSAIKVMSSAYLRLLILLLAILIPACASSSPLSHFYKDPFHISYQVRIPGISTGHCREPWFSLVGGRIQIHTENTRYLPAMLVLAMLNEQDVQCTCSCWDQGEKSGKDKTESENPSQNISIGTSILSFSILF